VDSGEEFNVDFFVYSTDEEVKFANRRRSCFELLRRILQIQYPDVKITSESFISALSR